MRLKVGYEEGPGLLSDGRIFCDDCPLASSFILLNLDPHPCYSWTKLFRYCTPPEEKKTIYICRFYKEENLFKEDEQLYIKCMV